MSSGLIHKNKNEQQMENGYVIAHDYLEEQREKEQHKGFTPDPVMAWINEDEYYESETSEGENLSMFERMGKKISKSRNDRILANIEKKFEKFDRQREKETLKQQRQEQKRLEKETKELLKAEKQLRKEQKKQRKAEEKRAGKEAKQHQKEEAKHLERGAKERRSAYNDAHPEFVSANKADKRKVHTDKVRHGFYSFIKGFVKVGRFISGRDREARNTKENSPFRQNLQEAYDRMYAMYLDAELNGTLEEFNANYGAYYERLKIEYEALRKTVDMYAKEEEKEAEFVRQLQQTNAPMQFGSSLRANVVGGTKPASVQYSQDGSKWLVKESLSCIGVAEPNAAIVTEAGYKIQKLVSPDTAIEAFKGKSVGKGVVSYQRMVAGVKKDVDLFKFSRTPDSMTEDELKRIEELAPQILREHTTDWLLCNFDTKGENFIIANDGTGQDRVYGIDKEAAFRAILDKEAQHMSKDYQKFDQDTVYNQLFRLYAQGKIKLDLHAIEAQILKVEELDYRTVYKANGEAVKEQDTGYGDREYMRTFEGYIDQQKKDRPEKVMEIERNILRRKQNLRMEYRNFLGGLVRERIEKCPEEAEALREKYFGGQENGAFIFKSDTVETLRKERDRIILQKEEDQEELKRKAREADAADEKSYKRRHGFYDFSKAVIMGLKKFRDIFKNKKNFQEIRSNGETEMVRDEEIHLGGTKPMSQYIAADGSQWLAKQAVNCMGYYKIEGALLTEAGAKLQKIVHPKTAVDAFVGRTRKHGDVSFQRRLQNVEGGPNKLDLFKFSKHPELATRDTIRAVEELGPQILREHTTDWLLCNFDTKGENFIITKEENGPRVLHGIDKEAAFNKILKTEAQTMSRTYKPHANNTLYNVVFSMYANCEINLNLFDVLPQIEKVQSLSDADYMATFKEYLDHVQKTKPDQYQQIYDNILARKIELKKEYARFFSDLVKERCKHLHPEEAAALRAKYLGEDGKFRFPPSEAEIKNQLNSAVKNKNAEGTVADAVEEIIKKVQEATANIPKEENIESMQSKVGNLLEEVARDNIDKVAQSEYMEKFMEALKKLGED